MHLKIYVKTKAKKLTPENDKHTTHTLLFEPSHLINSQSSDIKRKRTAKNSHRKSYSKVFDS